MNVLPNEHELGILEAAADFLKTECTPALVRQVEQDYLGYAPELWKKIAALGWLGLCLPEEHGGQGLSITFLGLLLEEVGRYIAPLPLHATMVPALVIARHGSARQRQLLSRVATGELIMSFAVTEKSGQWSTDAIELSGRREGSDIVLSGAKCFVDQFATSQKCLVTFRLDGEGVGRAGLAAILVDTQAPGIRIEALRPTAKDSESIVTFDSVRVPAENIVGMPGQGAAVIDDLIDYAAVLLVPMMQGAARHAITLAMQYVNNREAFGQPIGAFQAIQHMAADMLNAADGSQLLAREAIWRLAQGLPARVEVSQAKAFANEKCLMVCRSSQQMHGGSGFIAVTDINLWYRRVVSWGLRCGTSYEHRKRVASAILDTPGNVRLGMPLDLPAHAS
jgi:alkylation response protein AidB-like acyl-CoA dehydrogenase